MKKRSSLLSVIVVVIVTLLVVACSTPTATPQPTATTRPGQTPSPTTAATQVAATQPVPSATPSKVWTLKYDCYNAPTVAMSQAAKYFFDTVAQKSGGRIKMEYYWSESLHRAGEQAKAVRDGTSETAYHYMGYTPAQFPLTMGLDQMYITRSPDALAKAAKEVYNTYYPLRYEYEVKNNIHVMYLVPMEPVTLISKKPINSIEDLKGLKIRAAGVGADTLSRLGASPVSMLFTECFEALQRGTIDAVFSVPFASAYLMKLYDAGKYWTDIGAGHYATAAEMMNKQVWDGLPEDIKALYNETADKAIDFYIDTLNAQGRQFVDELIAKNYGQLSIWPDDLQAKAKALVQPAQLNLWIDQVKAQGFDGKEFTDTIKSILTKYTPQTRYVSPYDYYVKVKK